MPIILRDVPKGMNWGWYSREDQRMHLQALDPKEPKQAYKVWLEERGKRVFQPVGKVPSSVLKEVRNAVAQQRQWIEDKWVRLMLNQRWLQLHVALPEVTLIAYPNNPSKFVRKLDLSRWYTPDQLETLRPEAVVLDREMASLRLWADRPEELVPEDLRLSSLLWQA